MSEDMAARLRRLDHLIGVLRAERGRVILAAVAVGAQITGEYRPEDLILDQAGRIAALEAQLRAEREIRRAYEAAERERQQGRGGAQRSQHEP